MIGGQTETLLFSDQYAVMKAEIFDPVTKQFTALSAMKVPRTYHSMAILMIDGRVLVAGGGLCGGCPGNHRDFEIFVPPYLTNGEEMATQPVIQSAPDSFTPGSLIAVTMDKSHTFALIRTSAVTHAVNNDQRRIPLSVSSKSGKTFTLQIPSNLNVAITGVCYCLP